MKIIYPTDGSKTAAAALEFAIDIARCRGARIVVLSVAPELDGPREALGEMSAILRAFAGEQAREAAEKARRSGVEVEEHVETGKPADVIVRTARDENAYAIVMGTHGRTGLSRSFIGSVADRVIRRASCSVILVPSKEDI
jgi:nucleotide-binding universal stress UspA family protein